jgi:hypothetical protein
LGVLSTFVEKAVAVRGRYLSTGLRFVTHPLTVTGLATQLTMSSHRKKPFSAKQKKKQLQERKQRKAGNGTNGCLAIYRPTVVDTTQNFVPRQKGDRPGEFEHSNTSRPVQQFVPAQVSAGTSR